MARSHVRRASAFDVAPAFVVPDVSPLLPSCGRTDSVTEHWRSDFFDTADCALLRAGMTLQRRRDDVATRWQLKVPQASFGDQVRIDSADEDLPEELSELLLGARRGEPLTQLASVQTEREVTRLLDASGVVVAEIADDAVSATARGGGGATASTWRAVELDSADPELLRALDKRLRRAGAVRAAASSTLVRALPPNLTRLPTQPLSGGSSRRPRRAGDLIAAYLSAQQHAILMGDLALRRGEDGVIHKTRVAVRRTRSTLRVFGGLLVPERAARLDGELRWFAALLGDVRDRQVLRGRLDAMLDAVDDSLILGPVRARVDSELRREQAEHWRTLQNELVQHRYLQLLAELDRWVTDPPFTRGARAEARSLRPLVDRAARSATRRLSKANHAGDRHRLHSARKAAKRARYAYEAAGPAIGVERAARHAKRYRKLQDVLGEYQDSAVSAELLRRLGTVAGTTPGENGFTFGILHEREQQQARAARRRARRGQ